MKKVAKKSRLSNALTRVPAAHRPYLDNQANPLFSDIYTKMFFDFCLNWFHLFLKRVDWFSQVGSGGSTRRYEFENLPSKERRQVLIFWFFCIKAKEQLIK